MPVIVSVGRSGTTLLRLMLDSHPELAIPPETGFLPALHRRRSELDAERLADLIVAAPPWPDFHLDEAELRTELRRLRPFSVAAGARCFYRLYAAGFGKRRWGDKTPIYARHMPAIQELLPEARFVHLIRDGRDVALSLRPLWFAPGQDAHTLAAHWREGLQAARRDAPSCRHYLEVRYEDLVVEPERVLARVCAFLDLAYTPEILAYPARAAARLGEVRNQRQPDGRLVTRAQRLGHHPFLTAPPLPDRAGRWRQEMSTADVAEFEAVAGDLLAALGYESGSR